MAKIFKKENLSWLIPTIILIANIFVVYYGRIYYPNNFHPKETSFFENYWVLCLFEIGCVAIPALIIGLICLMVIMVVPKWNREIHLSIFRSWNPEGYRMIKDSEEAKEKGISLSQYSKENEHPFLREEKENKLPYNKPFTNKFEYKSKTKIQITNWIVLETFETDDEFYKAVTPYDSVFGKTKNDIIKMLNDGEDYHYSVGAYFCLLEGVTIQAKKEDIIKEVEKLDDFKWIRVSYCGDINNLTEFEKQKFENMKHRGFPNYNT